MSKQGQRKLIQINHAISGYYGETIKQSAHQVYEVRKDILKKLQRKKKLAPPINDELYSYLQKYPQQKLGLHQQSFKKKKAKMLEGDEKSIYRTPFEEIQCTGFFTIGFKNQTLFPFMIQQSSSQSEEASDS